MTDWITKQPSSGVAGTHESDITVPEYEGRQGRTGTVTGSTGSASDVLVVNQAGQDIIKFVGGLLDGEISQKDIPYTVQTSYLYVKTNLLNIDLSTGGLGLPDGEVASVVQGSTVLQQAQPFEEDFPNDPGAAAPVVCIIAVRPSQNNGRNSVGYRVSASGENDDEEMVSAFLSVIQAGRPEFIEFDDTEFHTPWSDNRIVVTGSSNSPVITFSLKWDAKPWCDFEGPTYDVNGTIDVTNGMGINPDVGATDCFDFAIYIGVPTNNTNSRPREAVLIAVGSTPSVEANTTLIQDIQTT